MQDKYSFGHGLSKLEEPIGPAYNVYRLFMKELAISSQNSIAVDADSRLSAIHTAVDSTRKALLEDDAFRVDTSVDLDTNQLKSTLVYGDVSFPLDIAWSLPNIPTAFGTRQIEVSSYTYAGAWAHLQTRGIIAGSTMVGKLTDGLYLVTLPSYQSDADFLTYLNAIPNLSVRKSDQLSLLADYENGRLTNYRLVIKPEIGRPTVLSFEKD